MSDYMKEMERLIDALIFAHPHEVEKWRERLLAHAAQAEPECTCKASDMPFGRCCKLTPNKCKWCGHDIHAHDKQYGCAEDGCDCETPNAGVKR